MNLVSFIWGDMNNFFSSFFGGGGGNKIKVDNSVRK